VLVLIDPPARDYSFVHRTMMEIMGALNALHGRGGIENKHVTDVESTHSVLTSV